MINKFESIPFFLILIFPFLLITGPAIPDISISIIGIFFIFLLVFTNQFFEIYKNKWVLLSIFFWFFLLFISLFSENRYLAFGDSIIFIRILLIPIFIYFWILKDENKIKKLTFVVFAAVLFVCLDSLYQFTNYDAVNGFGHDIFGYVPDFYGRLTGPFKDLIPGAYISKFALIGLLFIFLYIKNKNFQNITSIIYLILVGVVTYISGERMALTTFLLGLFLLIIFLKKRRIIIISSVALIFFACFIINKTHPIYNDYKVIESSPFHLGLKVEKYYKCNNNIECTKIINLQPKFFMVLKNFSNSAYGEIYSLAVKMWKDHPVNGIGLNNYYYLCKNDKRYIEYIKFKKYNIQDCVSHPHNFYLQWLVETGIFGLLIFITYILSIFYFIIKKKSNLFTIIALATLAILFWPIMSTGSLLKNHMGISTFYIMGICLSISRLKN